jgi:hypothetical protein
MGNNGFFGNAFDFNNDGRLDALEQAADFGMFVQAMELEETDLLDPDELNSDDFE